MELKIKDSIVLYSEEDHELVSEYKWKISSQGYCDTQIDGLPMKMHRLVMDCPDDKVVDHINGNKLDNRRENLQITTQSKNTQNQRKQSDTTSIYKGVSFDKKGKKYRAQISVDGRVINLGHYLTQQEAANARDMYIVHELPESNFPLNFPDLKDEYITTNYVKKIIKEVKARPIIDKTDYECVEDTEEIIRIIIPSRPNEIALIDTEDYELIRYDRWSLTYGYLMNSKKQLLHRVVMDVLDKPKILIDHIDGNKLNNTKANLRHSNPQLNAQNKPKNENASSQYYGVSIKKLKNSTKWEARVTNKGKKHYIGSYEDELDAAQAYDDYIKEHFPDSHYNLNFPNEE